MQELLKAGDIFTCAKFATLLSCHHEHPDGGEPVVDRSRMSTYESRALTVVWTERKDGWERKREVDLDLKPEDAQTLGQALFRVTDVRMQGGGAGHGPHDVYPDGHHVTAVELDGKGRTVAFYQSGSFVGMCEPDAVTVV